MDALHADLIGPFLPEGHPDAGEEVLRRRGWTLAPRAKRTTLGLPSPTPSADKHFPASMGLSVFLPPGCLRRVASAYSSRATLRGVRLSPELLERQFLEPRSLVAADDLARGWLAPR